MTPPAPCKCGCDTTDRATKIAHAHAGREFTADTRARMSASAKKRWADGVPPDVLAARVRARTGKKHPPDCGHCAAIRGERHPKWKGGVSQRTVVERLRTHGGQYDYTVTRRAVLDRDNWTCWLCHGSIPDILWVQDEMQPDYGTVDHIKPLSERGDHTWDNVRAAHMRCNAERWYASRRESKHGHPT